ncbi:MAG: efflux RND transporter periplasmic adaptor subunit [Gammaproteobacteria bacterium]
MKVSSYISIIFFACFCRPLLAAELVATLDWANPQMLAFPVLGVVEVVNAQPGQQVKRGQLLAKLDQQPFKFAINRHQASVDVVEPLIEDARREYQHAQELFEQTVLSEVELQKKQAQLLHLQAQQKVALQDVALARWQQQRSVLLAPADGVLIRSNLIPGQVISRENQDQIFALFAQTTMMALGVDVSPQQRTAFSLGQILEVNIDKQRLKAQVSSINIKATEPVIYHMVLQFKPTSDQQYVAGQAATVVY